MSDKKTTRLGFAGDRMLGGDAVCRAQISGLDVTSTWPNSACRLPFGGFSFP